jgi:hypothetical protein
MYIYYSSVSEYKYVSITTMAYRSFRIILFGLFVDLLDHIVFSLLYFLPNLNLVVFIEGHGSVGHLGYVRK